MAPSAVEYFWFLRVVYVSNPDMLHCRSIRSRVLNGWVFIILVKITKIYFGGNTNGSC